METKVSFEEPLKKVIDDHKNISEQEEILEHVLTFLLDQGKWAQIEPVKSFFESIIDHFRFEEKDLFPKLLSYNKEKNFKNFLLELKDEHVKIDRMIKDFFEMSSEKDIFEENVKDSKLNYLGRQTIDQILEHAAKEDESFLPMVQKYKELLKVN